MKNTKIKTLALLLSVCLIAAFLPAASVAATAGAVNAGVDFSAETGLLADDSYLYLGTYRHASALSEGTYGVPVRDTQATPILWQVKGEEEGDGKLGLLSHYVLDSMAFDAESTQGHNVYGTSDLRGYLNGAFLTDNFAAGEIAAMPDSTVVTRMFNSTKVEQTGLQQGTQYPVTTTDRAYLPTGNARTNVAYWTASFIAEDNNGVEYDRISPNHAQLKSQAGTDAYVYYWLRAPYYAVNAVLFVPERSVLGTLGVASPGVLKGVRPVVKLDPESIVFASEILADTTGRPDATAADAYYAQPESGSAYKLTVLGGGGDENPYTLTDLTYHGATVSAPIPVLAGGTFTVWASGNDTEDTTVNYKIVNGENAIVGYGVGSETVADGETAIHIATGTLAPGSYTAYVWLQKNHDMTSHEASVPIAIPISVVESGYAPVTVQGLDADGTVLYAETIHAAVGAEFTALARTVEGRFLSGSGSKTITVSDIGENIVTFDYSETAAARVDIRTAETSLLEDPVEYIVSIANAKGVMNATVRFEVDGAMLDGQGLAVLLDGFSAIDRSGSAILWTPKEGSIWQGEVVLLYLDGADGFSSALEEDLFKVIYAARELGEAVMKITEVRLAGLNEAGEGIFLDAEIGIDEAVTLIKLPDKVYSKYDLNRDGVIDERDLAMAQRYYQVKEGDANWEAASACDFIADGIVDILDLVDLFLHFGIY